MKPFSEMGDAELAAELRGIRPEPNPIFAAELDQRVAAGFPRRSREGEWTPLANLVASLRGSRWRLLIPVGGLAIALIAAATVVVAGSHSGGVSGETTSSSASGEITTMGGPSDEEASAGAAVEAAPKAQGRFEAEAAESAGAANGGAGIGAGAATGAAHRDVERGAQIVIGTRPGEVGEASSKVFEAVHAYAGIVLRSSTQNGSGANAKASFELLIPSAKVADAMAALSRIGEVVNRQETSNDITAPTVGAGERLQDSEARIDGLLAQLSESTIESEREVVEAELEAERRHAAHLKSKLASLKRRANLSRVSVRIVSGRGALTPGSAGGGDWGVGDALGDAGHLLSVAAGVTIIGFAVLAPLLLLALLAWLASRAWTRRARERALT